MLTKSWLRWGTAIAIVSYATAGIAATVPNIHYDHTFIQSVASGGSSSSSSSSSSSRSSSGSSSSSSRPSTSGPPSYNDRSSSSGTISRPTQAPTQTTGTISRPGAAAVGAAAVGAAAVGAAAVGAATATTAAPTTDSKPPATAAPPSGTITRPTATDTPSTRQPYQQVPAATINRPAPQQTQQTPTPLPRSKIDQNIARGQSAASLSAFNAEQNKFKQPPSAAPETKAAAQANPVWQTYGSKWNSADQYYASRNNAARNLPQEQNRYWQSPPPYVVNAAPSYGPYSGMFMGGLLGFSAGIILDESYTRWAYAHRQEESYKHWHEDMERQAKTNEDLRLRLAVLDAKVKQQEDSGAKADDAAILPTNVDASLVVAPDTVLLATSKDEGGFGWIIFFAVFGGIAIIGGILVFWTSRKSKF